MKTLVLSNQKGGVGKSAFATQAAYYFSDRLGLRTLVWDLDAQRNTTKPVAASNMAVVSEHGASQYLLDKTTPLPTGQLVLLPGDDGLLKLEKQAALHNTFAGNMREVLRRASEHFDVCIIDTNPFPDIRTTAALVSADFVLSPIQLNQEAIDGISSLRRDIKVVTERMNQKLQLIGLLPNLVTPTPFHKANFELIAKLHGKLLIRTAEGKYAALKERTAVAEAQAAAVPIYKQNKTSAREAWREWEEALSHVAITMGVK